MALSPKRLHRMNRVGLIGLKLLASLALVVTIALIVIEERRATPRLVDAKTGFREGCLRTELVPLPVAAADTAGGPGAQAQESLT